MKIDSEFNGIKILEIEGMDGNRNQRRYFVFRSCCKSKMWLGHNRILAIKRMDHDSLCRKCDERSSIRRARREQTLVDIDPRSIYVSGWGFTLGKMGRR